MNVYDYVFVYLSASFAGFPLCFLSVSLSVLQYLVFSYTQFQGNRIDFSVIRMCFCALQ